MATSRREGWIAFQTPTCYQRWRTARSDPRKRCTDVAHVLREKRNTSLAWCFHKKLHRSKRRVEISIEISDRSYSSNRIFIIFLSSIQREYFMQFDVALEIKMILLTYIFEDFLLYCYMIFLCRSLWIICSVKYVNIYIYNYVYVVFPIFCNLSFLLII